MFKTQQGRTLYRDDLTVEDITRALGSVIEVIGYEFGDAGQTPIHASTRHVVEWWDPGRVAVFVRRGDRIVPGDAA